MGIVNIKGTLSFANRECCLEFRFGRHQNSWKFSVPFVVKLWFYPRDTISHNVRVTGSRQSFPAYSPLRGTKHVFVAVSFQRANGSLGATGVYVPWKAFR